MLPYMPEEHHSFYEDIRQCDETVPKVNMVTTFYFVMINLLNVTFFHLVLIIFKMLYISHNIMPQESIVHARIAYVMYMLYV